MMWRLSRKDWSAGAGQGNCEAMKAVFETGPPPGIIGWLGEEPVGWLQVDERAAFSRLATSRVLWRRPWEGYGNDAPAQNDKGTPVLSDQPHTFAKLATEPSDRYSFLAEVSMSVGHGSILSRCCASDDRAWNRSHLSCKFIQNPGEVLKNLARRRAVPGVTPLRPRTISFTRW